MTFSTIWILLSATLGGYQPHVPDAFYMTAQACQVAAMDLRQTNQMNAYCVQQKQVN